MRISGPLLSKVCWRGLPPPLCGRRGPRPRERLLLGPCLIFPSLQVTGPMPLVPRPLRRSVVGYLAQPNGGDYWGATGAPTGRGALLGPFLSAATLIGFAALSNRFFSHRFRPDYRMEFLKIPLQYQAARQAGQIVVLGRAGKAGRGEDGGHRIALVRADLKQQPAIRTQPPGQPLGDRPIAVETVLAPMERQVRLVTGHLGHE